MTPVPGEPNPAPASHHRPWPLSARAYLLEPTLRDA